MAAAFLMSHRQPARDCPSKHYDMEEQCKLSHHVEIPSENACLRLKTQCRKLQMARNHQNAQKLLKLSKRKVSLHSSVAERAVEVQLVGISSDSEDSITQRARHMHQAKQTQDRAPSPAQSSSSNSPEPFPNVWSCIRFTLNGKELGNSKERSIDLA